MRERLNRLIAALLVVAMVMMPAMVVLAAESSTADTAENDEYYQEAAGFLNYLGIMVGDEKGDMHPEETITRAEIAAIILRETNISSKSEYSGIFEDVDPSHWAADDIQTAYEMGIIAGYGDDTFGPDDDVTYEQAVKMVVCAIGWGQRAELMGEYPTGYIRQADELKILDHAKGGVGDEIKRRTVAKLVYDSLTADYPVVTGTSVSKSGAAKFDYETRDGVTILSEKRKIYWQEGMVTATPNKAIGASVSLDDDQIAIENEVMQSEVENAEQYVADYARVYYYDNDGSGSDKVALYIVPLTNKTNTKTFDASEIDSIVTGYVDGDENKTKEIKYYENGNTNSKKSIKLVNQPAITYNDQSFTAANYESIPDAEKGDSFDDFITPYEGTIRAVDFDKDGTYDVLFIDSYETAVVKTVTSIRLQVESEFENVFGGKALVKLDPSEDSSLKLTVIRDEEPCELKNLQVGDVLSIKKNANFNDTTYTGDKIITIEATLDYVDGTPKNLSSDTATEKYTTIDGEKYKILDVTQVYNDVKAALGSKARFYLNKFGTISYVDSHATGSLSSGEKYGWLVTAYASENGNDTLVELYSSDGGYQTLTLNSTVDYWDQAEGHITATDDQIQGWITNNTSSGGHFLSCRAEDFEEKASIRLCKYKTNSSGKVNKLYLAIEDNNANDQYRGDAVLVVAEDLKSQGQKGGLFAGKYYIESGVPQITAPITLTENRDASNYGYRIADHEDYTTVTGDDGLGYNCFFADVKDAQPGVIIRFTKSTSEAQSIEDYKTAADNRVILISDISQSVNDDDEEVYVITGWREGEEREYTTATNVLVAQVNAAEPWGNTNATYNADTIWTNSYNTDLTDVLHVGDICGISGSNNSIGIVLRMVDAKGLADHLVETNNETIDVQAGQFFKDEMFSSSRDRIIFGKVVSTRTSPVVQIGIKNDGSYDFNKEKKAESDDVTLYVALTDVTRVVQFEYISGRGKITVDEEMSDPYEIQEGDYIFLRNYRNDTGRELFVIRYEG